MNRKIRAALAAVATAAAVSMGAGSALATECVPNPGQEYVAPTYAVEHEYTRTIPGTDPVLGEAPVITPGVDAWTETIEHEAVPPVLGEAPVIDPGQEYVAPTVECWGVYRHWITGKTKTSAVDLGWGWVKIGTEYVTTDPGQEYVPPTYGERPVITPGVDAWTETIEHAAVPPVLGERPVLEPGTDPVTDTVWGEDVPDGEGWEPTGNTRSGEGITRVTDPGQEYVAPVTCVDTNPLPTEPVDPTDPGTNTPTDPAPTEPIDQGDDVTPPAPVQPAAAVVAQQAVAEPVSEPKADELATTGTSPLAGVALAVVLLLAGLVLVAAFPRRRTQR